MFTNFKQKDWGKGIPNYSEDDVMTSDDLYDCALDVVAMVEVDKNGYEPVEANPSKDSMPSMVLKINGKLSFILVEASVAPKMPSLSPIKKANFIHCASKYDADAYYAPVGFGSVDGERFKNSLALRGDAYYPRYCGLEKVTLNESDVNSLEYKLYVMDLIGKGYQQCDYDLFKEYVDADCVWYSVFSQYRYQGKKEIAEYYYPKFETIARSGTNIDYQFARFVQKDQKYRNKPTLLITQESNGNQVSMILDLSFNEKGKVNEMTILDPDFIALSME